MPIFAAIFSALFSAFGTLIAFFWAKKISVAAVAVLAFAAALVVLMAVFNALVAPFLAEMFSSNLGQFVGLAFPPIAGTCMASLGTCWGACALYKLKMQAIRVTAAA